jgi:2-succinyl-5-enolpyruvyl-6-hydroxy-3-cyclohexene-1-carboxylate synthase
MSQVFPPFQPEDVQAAFAAVLVDEWVRGGVTDAVACPGSRSTPLLMALAEAEENGLIRLHMALDERSAAFFALGLGKASGVPAPVVTTSGTAAAELHAAVMEADHAGVPMIAVTADRPPELHDWGAPQTVRQEGIFGPSTRWAVSPGVPEAATAWSWRSLASRALLEAVGGARPSGPVHLNLAFREPLIGRASAFLGSLGRPDGGGPGCRTKGREVDYQQVTENQGCGQAPVALAQREAGAGPELGPPGGSPGARVPSGLAQIEESARLAPALALLAEGRAGRAPWHTMSSANSEVPAEVVEILLSAGQRGLVVAGQGAGTAEAVRAFSNATGWPVLADPLSGCRWEGSVCAADALLRTVAVRGWRPGVVLRLGSPWASRVLNEWLGSLDCPQWLVDRWGRWHAPDRLPGQVVVADPEALCWAAAARAASRAASRAGASQAPAPNVPAGAREGGWPQAWARAEAVAQQAIDSVLSTKEGLTGPLVARTLVRCLPAGATLVAASSMPVRDLEWWGGPREGLRVLCNRGANGIDGVLSTALGVAAALAGARACTEPEVPAAQTSLAGPSQPSGCARAPEKRARVVALVGDLAFVYDASALLWAQKRGLSLDVVVVDNSGGGIFSFLPQARLQPRARFERLWGTPHELDLVALARTYGAEARLLQGPDELAEAVSASEARPGARVWVAATSRDSELAVREELWSAVDAEVTALLKQPGGLGA